MAAPTTGSASMPLPPRLAIPLAFALLLALSLVADFLWASSSSSPSPRLPTSSSKTVKGKNSNRARGKALPPVGHLNATYADLPAPLWDWEEMPPAPVPRLDGASVQIGDLLYVFAGYESLDHAGADPQGMPGGPRHTLGPQYRVLLIGEAAVPDVRPEVVEPPQPAALAASIKDRRSLSMRCIELMCNSPREGKLA